MEKLIEIFNEGSGLNLKQGDSVVLFDSKAEKAFMAGRSSAKNFTTKCHEAFKETLIKAGIEPRE